LIRSESDERAERHALTVLEFPRVLERIASHASSDPGRTHVLALRPWREPEEVDEALAIADEMVSLLLRLERWTPPPIPDAERLVRKAQVEGAVLDPEQLGSILSLLRASRIARADLRKFPEDLPRLADLAESTTIAPMFAGLVASTARYRRSPPYSS